MSEADAFPEKGLRLRGTVGGETVLQSLREGELTAGSDPAADLPIRSAGVSRRHASLSVSGGAVRVRDLGSKNGTFVNGLRIEEARLVPGDWLQLGPVKLLLEEVDSGDVRLGIVRDRKTPKRPAPASRDLDTETSVRGAHEGPAGWLETLERVQALVDERRRGGVYEVLDALVRGVGAAGAMLLEQVREAEPIVLATSGLASAWGVSGSSGGPERVLRAEQRAADGSGLILLVAGDFPSRDAAQPLLRLVLRAVVGDRRAPVVPAAKRPHRSLDELRYPEGTVRGRSPAARAMERELLALAPNDLPVLLLGETGVGKELVAGALHLSSPRSRGPFLALNCAAIPAELLEAELFGVVRGAATGVAERRGALELASGGVLFLDEVGDMALPLQAKLLRALQQREVLPVGAGAPRSVDVRVVSATNSDIEARVEDGTFRRDLYYRLSGAVVRVPPLRERKEDIPALVDTFFRRQVNDSGRDVRGVTVKAIEILVDARWPGNVRQLQHVVRRLVASCPEGQSIDSSVLPVEIQRNGRAWDMPANCGIPGDDLPLRTRVEVLERTVISAALEEAGGNRSLASRRLGLSRNGLLKKLRRFRIEGAASC